MRYLVCFWVYVIQYALFWQNNSQNLPNHHENKALIKFSSYNYRCMWPSPSALFLFPSLPLSSPCRECSVLVVDLGCLEVKSDLRQSMPDVKVSLHQQRLHTHVRTYMGCTAYLKWSTVLPLFSNNPNIHVCTYNSVHCMCVIQKATDEELDEAFYDHFTLKLSRLQVLMAGPGESWTEAWAAMSSPLHLLEPTALEVWLKKSLWPNDTRLAK